MKNCQISRESHYFSVTKLGGEGIRTLDTNECILPFQGSAFDRSATPPYILLYFDCVYYISGIF